MAAGAEGAEGATMEGILSQFSSRVLMLKKAMVLRDASLSKRTHVDALSELAAELDGLAEIVADTRAYIDGEEAQVEEAEAVLRALDAQQARVEQIQGNLPAQLPRHSPTPDENTAPLGASAGGQKKKKKKSGPKISKIEYVRVDEFNDTPKYIRGRISRDQVNQTVDILNDAMVAKHKILALPRSKLSDLDLNRWTSYKEAQSVETDGRAFVVDGDIKDLTSHSVDSAMRTCFAVLRHLGRLKEIRGGGLTRYVMC